MRATSAILTSKEFESQPSQKRRWLTVRETAAILKCHPMTVYSWIDSGRLKAARIGRRFLRVDGKLLEAELEAQAAGSTGLL